MIQAGYECSETLSALKTQFPQDTSIHKILDEFKRREAFEFDLMEFAGRVTKPSAPETELFYHVCYEDIYRQMFEGLDGEGRIWLLYGDFTAKLGDKETQQAYKNALEQALKIFKNGHADFVEAREALHRLAMFWYLREN